MKLDAYQLVSRILPRRQNAADDPPPPYTPNAPDQFVSPPEPSPAQPTDAPLARTTSPRRPLPVAPSSPHAISPLARSDSTVSSSNTTLSPGVILTPNLTHTPYRRSAEVIRSAPVAPIATSPRSSHYLSDGPRRHPSNSRPSGSPPSLSSPVYRPPTPRPKGKASFNALPVSALHRILTYALDPRQTPEPWQDDVEIEDVRRLHWLFCDFRSVNRRCFLLSTSILRERLLPTYTSLLQVQSSDPLPPAGSGEMTAMSVFAQRSREAAVLDRFVAMRLGEDLRRAESALCEDSGEMEVIFSRLQPAARVEDLLLCLSPNLISRTGPAHEYRLPLPHAHVAVTLSPRWAKLWLSYSPINPVSRADFSMRAGKSLVVEVRKEDTPEDMVRAFGMALGWLSEGKICWGWSFRKTT